jgi:alkaline phosphatase D
VGEVRALYRKFSFGNLLELFMLDLRQYRDEQPASPVDSSTINSPARTLLGTPQQLWLQGNLVASPAKWKFMGNSVQIAPIIVISAFTPPSTQALLQAFFGIPAGSTAPTPLNVDSWDGYASARAQILGLIAGGAGRPVPNCVFLTGDIHSSYACDLPANPATYETMPVSLATEFVCTSVTSDNVNELVGQPERIPDGLGGYIPNPATAGFETLVRGFNAWVKDVNLDFHGFSVVDVTSQRTQVDNWVIRSDASPAFAADPRIDPNAAAVFRSAYQTLDLSQKVIPAGGPLGPRI